MGQLLSVAPWPRPERCKTHRWRQVSGDAGVGGRSVYPGQIPALYSPFLPKRILRYPALQGEPGGQNAQGRPCSGEQESRPGEGQSCRGRTAGNETAKKVEDGVEETLTYCEFPFEHWTRIRTNNVIERLNREIRRRTRVVGTFPDGNSALMLVCARLRHVAGAQKYMNMKHLEAALEDASIAG